jgi:nucleotide-binding universal stress UspA family protein
MSFADILLCIVPTAEAELERLALAVELSQTLQARLDGVFISKGDGSKADWAQKLFERAVGRSSLETTWRVVDGHSAAGLLFQARRSDLTVLPGFATDRTGQGAMTKQLALESGRPILILPTPAAPTSIGRVVLVAWNDTRESARAIHDAMPILVNADRVRVLTVLTDGGLEPLADRRLVEHLRQHGVAAELGRRHGDVAEEIAAEARELEADLIVMGLYGQTDGSSASLGDVSQRFVRTASTPVFFSH